MQRDRTLAHACIGELLGTFLLVFFGTGSVWVAVSTGALTGLMQVALVWGLGIALAIYATAALSGAHLNPAVTLAMVLVRGFPVSRVLPYVLAQLAGAIAAALVLLALLGPLLQAYEARNGIVRGAPGSERSAMVFGEYFPNPAIVGVDLAAAEQVSMPQAMLAEGLGTALLVLAILSLTDDRNRLRPHPSMQALMIGMTVAILIAVIAPVTQAGLNPARDLGPRLVAWFAGWGEIAIPGPRGGWLLVYVLAPLLGAVAGAGAFRLLLTPAFAVVAGGTGPDGERESTP